MTVILTITQINSKTYADVGSFEDYSSSSDWSSSSSSSGPASDAEVFAGTCMLVIVLGIIVVVYIKDEDKRKMLNKIAILSIVLVFAMVTISLLIVWLNSVFLRTAQIFIFLIVLVMFLVLIRRKSNEEKRAINHKKSIQYNNSEVILKIIKSNPTFNKEEFEKHEKDVFIKLQNAWIDRDWKKLEY